MSTALPHTILPFGYPTLTPHPPACPPAPSCPIPIIPTPCFCCNREEEEEVLVDRSALLPRPQQAPARKKRWYKWEDRELLTAWAGCVLALYFVLVLAQLFRGGRVKPY